MICLNCGGKTRVIDSRFFRDEVVRKRICKQCHMYTYSHEKAIDPRKGEQMLYVMRKRIEMEKEAGREDDIASGL